MSGPAFQVDPAALGAYGRVDTASAERLRSTR